MHAEREWVGDKNELKKGMLKFGCLYEKKKHEGLFRLMLFQTILFFDKVVKDGYIFNFLSNFSKYIRKSAKILTILLTYQNFGYNIYEQPRSGINIFSGSYCLKKHFCAINPKTKKAFFVTVSFSRQCNCSWVTSN